MRLLWDDEGAGAVTETELLARRQNFGPGLPDRAAILTAGVHVQGDRVEVSVCAWTTGEERWLITHRVIPGDPSGPGLWAALDSYLLEPWKHPAIGPMPIHAACVDSGGHSSGIVCTFCDERRGRLELAASGKYVGVGNLRCIRFLRPLGGVSSLGDLRNGSRTTRRPVNESRYLFAPHWVIEPKPLPR